MERKITLHFHKVLQKYTHTAEAQIAVDEYRELLAALFYLFPDLKKQICLSFSGKTNDFLTLVTKDKQIIESSAYLKNTIDNNILELWIVPSIYGKGKTAALVVGIALISIALFAIPAAAGTLGAGSGILGGYQALTGFAAFAAQTILGIGINLVLSFLLSFLLPKIDSKEEPSRVNNDMFEGLQITTQQNTPVPLNYGLIRHTGHLLSGSIGAGEPITEYIPGRFFWNHGGVHWKEDELLTSLDGSTWTVMTVGDPTNESYTAEKIPFAFGAGVDTKTIDLILVNDEWYCYICEQDEFIFQWAYKSIDGVNWTYIGYFPFLTAGVAFGEGKFVAVGQYNWSVWDDLFGTTPGDPFEYPFGTGFSADGGRWTASAATSGPLAEIVTNFLDDRKHLEYWSEKNKWLFHHGRRYGEQAVEPAHIFRSVDPSNSGWMLELATPGAPAFGQMEVMRVFPGRALVGWYTAYFSGAGWAPQPIWFSIDGDFWSSAISVPRPISPINTALEFLDVVDFATDGNKYVALCRASFDLADWTPMLISSNDGSAWFFEGLPFWDEHLASPPTTSTGFFVSRLVENITYDPQNGYWYIFGTRRDWSSVFLDRAFVARSKNLTGTGNWELVYTSGLISGPTGDHSRAWIKPGYYNISTSQDNPFTATPMTSNPLEGFGLGDNQQP